MKNQLKRELSQVTDFESPKVSLEQYKTPASLAADLIFTAYMQGDIEGKKVVDLGVGTGVLSIGAALMGGEVTAVEKDEDALEQARENAENLGVAEHIEFREMDIQDLDEQFDTVVMNPPFSVHSEQGIKFFSKALEVGESVYSVALASSRQRIKEFVKNSDHEIRGVESYKIVLPPSYGFHTEEARETTVDIIITKRA